MKATGIVRRIDDLGRIVTLRKSAAPCVSVMADPLEIYTSPDGEVIFKKYSPVGEISCTASQYADVLSKVGGCPAVICDRDHVIAVSGMAKKEVIERRVSGSLEEPHRAAQEPCLPLPRGSAAQPHRGYRPLRDSRRAYTLAGRRQRSRYHALRRRQRIRNERAECARPGCRNVLRQADGGIKIREGQRPPARPSKKSAPYASETVHRTVSENRRW